MDFRVGRGDQPSQTEYCLKKGLQSTTNEGKGSLGARI